MNTAKEKVIRAKAKERENTAKVKADMGKAKALRTASKRASTGTEAEAPNGLLKNGQKLHYPVHRDRRQP